jgi:hypothetical protein
MPVFAAAKELRDGEVIALPTCDRDLRRIAPVFETKPASRR